MIRKVYLVCIVAIVSSSSIVLGQGKKAILSELDKQSEMYGDKALQIWNFAEVGYKEYKSSQLLQDLLKENGFTIEVGVAGIPTAFVATYGSGSPTIGILGEYDALPGLSQAAVPEKTSLGANAGHGCGHHLFGVGSAAAAIATKNWMKLSGQKGTLKFYGTPAEEGGSGKVYMTREGLFNNVDVVLHWHPSDGNKSDAANSLANKTGKFRFHGLSAHAAASPERGRSALDGLEAMTHMVNMMREHVPEDARIHYIITDGGKAPNVVPDFAELYMYVRHPNRDVVKDMWNWMEQIAEGAAKGTQTTVDSEVIGGVHDLLPNESLAHLMNNNMKQIGGFALSPEEIAFAKKIQPTPGMKVKDLASTQEIDESVVSQNGGSTDVGDISWVVPTMACRTATWVPGTPAHSWQAVASGGTSIGTKGMILAAKTLATTAYDLFTTPSEIEKAKAEFEKRKGPDFKYEPLIGNRAPALNYRD
ncbi:aminobenzoyl-glutamate utilization protein B [Spirosomataceae bacterium TFI 002]|nr:aminobenzoyl-glutamate utilization protein B [Spirosomataceae bacterium TFI 002]